MFGHSQGSGHVALGIKLDADGVIYHEDYFIQLFWVIHQFKEKLIKYGNTDFIPTQETILELEEITHYIKTNENSFAPGGYHQVYDSNPDRIFIALMCMHRMHLLLKRYQNDLKLSEDKVEDLNILAAVVIRSSKGFFKYVCDRADELNAEIVDVASASNRQSFQLDEAGMLQNVTNSFFLDSLSLTKHLQKLMPHRQVVYSSFTVADCLIGNKMGTNHENVFAYYQKHLFGLKKPPQENLLVDYLCDVNKYSTIYLSINYSIVQLAKLLNCHPQAINYYATFMDDKHSIVNAQNNYFGKNRSTLASNVEYTTLLFQNGKVISESSFVIKGVGEIDYRIQNSYRLMLQLINEDLSKVDTLDIGKKLDFAQFLKLRDTGFYITGLEVVSYKAHSHHFLFSNVNAQMREVEDEIALTTSVRPAST